MTGARSSHVRTWKRSAREKERIKAKQQIARLTTVKSTSSATATAATTTTTTTATATHRNQDDDIIGDNIVDTDHISALLCTNYEEERLISDRYRQEFKEEIQQCLRRIETGEVSFFSMQRLLLYRPWISRRLIPFSWLSKYKIESLGKSRLGEDHVDSVLQYIEADANNKNQQTHNNVGVCYCTIVEYAVWLGEYRILHTLLHGRVEPWFLLSSIESGECDLNKKSLAEQLRHIFFGGDTPLSVSTYLVKRVVEMRLAGQRRFRDIGSDRNGMEKIAESDCEVLCFGRPCNHEFSEARIWTHILDETLNDDFVRNDDSKDDSYVDVLTCPVCGQRSMTPMQDACNKAKSDTGTTNVDEIEREFRRLESLRRFQALPRDAKELKAQPKRIKKKKNRRDFVASCWADAVKIGSSQQVRVDRWWDAASRRCRSFTYCYHVLHACLSDGIDVNMTNEYGQTALFIILWRWNGAKSQQIRAFQLLLDFGAHMDVPSNGGMTSWDLIKTPDENHEDNTKDDRKTIRRLALHYYGKDEEELPRTGRPWGLCASDDDAPNTAPQGVQEVSTQVLIAPDANHPGSGSFVLDGCISDTSLVSLLLELHHRIPPATTGKNTTKQQPLSSVRSYYCDIQREICHFLEPTLQTIVEKYRSPSVGVEAATTKGGSSLDDKTKRCDQVKVFQHFRFLSYQHEGSSLAPHVDLSRVDDSGLRSTHTLIVYLTDCEQGGETVLLEQVDGVAWSGILATVEPRKGRVLLFPHACPHAGAAVQAVPKIILRGEVYIPGYSHAAT